MNRLDTDQRKLLLAKLLGLLTSEDRRVFVSLLDDRSQELEAKVKKNGFSSHALGCISGR